MRPIWKGSLTFGLVHLPVELHSAVRAGERISFRQLHKRDHSPIKYQRVCEQEGDVVPWEDIVKGYEYAKGKFVVLDDDDFKAAALVSSKTFEILDFVRAEEIDPRFFEAPYYLLPGKDGDKAYALLREAMRRSGMVGIGKITMRSNSHHLAAVRVVEEALVLEIMRFASELVDVGSLRFPDGAGVRPQEVQMAEQLIANLAEPFTPGKYKDEYRENLQRVIKAKLKGRKVKLDEPDEPESTPVVDLMARLQESLAKGKRRPASRAATKSAAGKTVRRKRRTA